MICNCKDWKANIDILNGPIVLQAIRMGGGGYSGKPFEYCPWCGKELTTERVCLCKSGVRGKNCFDYHSGMNNA